jgi:hypothetical protein
MTEDHSAIWRDIAEDVRWYPSPHNSQPIKLRPSGAGAELYYDLDLGLPAESFGIPFAHVCAGVFLESLAVVAGARGYRVVEALELSEMDFSSTDRLHRFATVRLEPAGHDAVSRAAAEARLAAFRRRRTSRRPYDSSLVDDAILRDSAAIAESAGQVFRTTSDERLVTRVVRINQATLFSDLQDDEVYAEILHWLRFSRREAAESGDGLSAETMLMPGRVLRFAMGHRGMWRMPVLGAAIRWVYLRTMRGVRQLGWLEGPFAGPGDYIESGRTFMRIWLQLTAAGVFLHPFGTVITNPGSHAQLAAAVHADESDGRLAWMLFRLGHSPEPPASYRRPASAMLLEMVR